MCLSKGRVTFQKRRNCQVDRFRGGPNLIIIFGVKILVKCRKKFSGPLARKSGGSKNRKKRSFFGIKNVKNFKSGIQFFFLKKFQPANAAEKALCTLRHFSNRNHSKKNAKIPKISKILLSYFSKKKIEKKKYIFFPAAPRRHFIFRRLRRLFFFQ